MGFLQFLKTKKLLTDEQIINGMIFQEKNKSSLISVLNENENVNKDKLVDVIDNAYDKEITLIESIREKRLIPEDTLGEVLSSQMKKSSGIVQWILNEKILSSDEIEKVLADFNEVENNNDNASKIDNKISTEANSSSSKLNNAALESLADLGISTSELDDENEKDNIVSSSTDVSSNEVDLEINDENKEEEILDLIKSLVFGLDKEKIKILKSNVDSFLKNSIDKNIKLSEKCYVLVGKILQLILDDQVDFTKHNFTKIMSTIRKALVNAWEINEHFNSHGDLKKFLADSEEKNNYLNLIEDLLKISNKENE